MDIISIPQLKLGQLQSLTESSLSITEPITAIASERQKVQDSFKEFLAGMKKDGTSSEKKTLDKTRDNLLSGFFFSVKAEEYFPNTDTATTASHKQLLEITDSYGLKITRLPYDEETAAIDNLISRVEALDLTGLEHISRWIALIKTANENFKEASKDYLEQKVDSDLVDSATETAPELLAELENLYTMLFANAKVSSDDAQIRAYSELSELVNTYR